MKNILSIDFDIIMAPTINLYNGKVPAVKWEGELENDKYLQLATADLQHYQKLTEYLLYLTKKLPKEKIHFILDHEQIALKLNLDQEKEYIITNIDHHHDIAYNDKEVEYIEGMPNCADWAKWLIERGMVKTYRWINNSNSTAVFKEELNKMINITVDLSKFDLFSQIDPDEVFICLSPPWVPPMYRTLFYCWMDILNRIYDTHFDFEDWRLKND